MGKLILKNNGVETQYINGVDFSTLTPLPDVYYVGVNTSTGTFDKLNPNGDIIDFDTSGNGFTGGTVSGFTTFLNGLLSSNIESTTISATTYLNLPGGGGVIEVTYSELSTLINTNGLTKGSFYLITDFQTCYDQPDFDFNGNEITVGNYRQGPIEPLMVFAISESEISLNAFSPQYPNDSIKYDWTFNQTEVTSGTSYGRIIERIDDNGNRTDYDHRNILFKRYNSYSLDNQIQGIITQVNGPNVIGYETNFLGDLTIGDVVFIPSPGNIAEGFYTVTNIVDNFNMEVTGQTFYNFSYDYNQGVSIWTCIFETENTPGTTYYFNDEGTNNINDGGNDMYDGGNFLNTDQFGTIPYTHTQMTGVSGEATIGDFIMDGSVQSGVGYFGGSSSYFTNYYPGLFVMVADTVNTSYFEISGSLGADGSGTFDTYTYSTTVNGNNYTAYAKRVGDGGFDPSVNHIIIVNTDGTGLSHVVGSTTDDDLDRIENLDINGVTQIHYLLTGLAKGVMLTDTQVDCMVEAYLALTDGNDINTILSNLNSNYSNVTSCFPPKNNTSRSLHYRQSNVFENTGYTEVKTFEFVDAKNTYIGDFAKYRDYFEFPFLLANNVFGNILDNDSICYNNVIGDLSYNNTIGREFSYNRLVGKFSENTFYRNFYQNTISNEFQNNYLLDGDLYDNEIGTNFSNNTIITDLFRNNIGNSFQENFIRDNFQNNEIGNQFNNNIVLSEFYKNDIGNGYNNNKIFDSFYGNDITNGFNNNIIYREYYDNRISDYFSSNQILSDFYSNLIGLYYQNNFIGNGNSFYRNDIGNNFNNNTIYGEFQNNEIGNQFNNNICGGSQFLKNTIGNGFNGNEVSYFDSNKIGNGFNNNIIASNFVNNQIGDYFNNNRVTEADTNVIGNEFYNNRFGVGFGFYDFSDVTTRTYNTFKNSLNGNVGNYIIGRELILHDTISNEYYRVTFTKWTQGGNGGGFRYTRQMVYPSFGPTIDFERPDYSDSTIDIIVPGVLEIKRDNNGGGIYNVAVEGSFNSSVSPLNTEWNSNYTSPTNGSQFSLNKIGYQFINNQILGNDFSYNNIAQNFNGNINISNSFRKNYIKCDVTSVDFASASFVYGNYNCDVFENSNNIVRLSYYDGSDVLNITNINS